MLNTNSDPSSSPARSSRRQVVFLPFFLISGLIIALDASTKSLVDQNIPTGQSWLPDSLQHLLPYFRVVHVHNKGTAFSMFADAGRINLIISLLAAAVAVGILFLYPRIPRSERLLQISVILQFGGTVGNLISRLRYGYVLDFISIGDFAVFNLADSSLVAGALLMLAAVVTEEWRTRKKPETPPAM